MEQLKNEIKSKIRIQYNECFEFARAISWLCEHRERTLPEGIEICEEDKKVKDKLKQLTSKELLRELRWLYDNIGISGIIEAYAVDYHTATVDEMFYAIEGSDDVVFCNYLGGNYISRYQARYYRDWSEVKHSVALMKNYIKECQVIDDTTRENVVKCFESPRQARQKVLDVLQKFYKQSYAKVKGQVEKLLSEVQKQYMQQLFLTPIDFVNSYLSREFRPQNEHWPYRINIHLSLFQPVELRRLSIHDYIRAEGYLLLGKEAIQMQNDENRSRSVSQFMKALSDEKRLLLLKQLSIRPSYGQELAKKLNVTPATVKHHLNVLEDMELVKVNKSEHKVYYSLNREILGSRLQEVKEFLS